MAEPTAELGLDSVGQTLCRGREALGLSCAEVATVTRISERFIIALDAGDYAKLPGRPYALGFARAYARAVGLDPERIAAQLRAELIALADTGITPSIAYTPGDPSRVPGRASVWLGAIAVLVIIVAGLIFWRQNYAPAGALPSLLTQPAPIRPHRPTAAAPPSAAPLPKGTALPPPDGAGQ